MASVDRNKGRVRFASPYDEIAHAAAPSRPTPYVGATIRVPAGLSARDLVDAARRAPPDDSRAGVLFPPLWAPALERADAPTLLPAVIRAPVDPTSAAPSVDALSDVVTALAKEAFGDRAEEVTLRLNAPVPASAVNSAAQGWSGIAIPPGAPEIAAKPIVVMGVIDDGLPFAHVELRDAQGRSRVECCHLQPVFPPMGGPTTLGKEFSRADIDALVAAHGPDEDAVYAVSGALGFQRPDVVTLSLLASHGSFVLGAAAGFRHGRRFAAYEDAEADLDQLRVIAVQLPAQPEFDSALYGRDGAILAAAHYIFLQADKVAAAYGQTRVPLVVVCSYGYSAGAHNGGDDIEVELAAMRALRQAAPVYAETQIVIPAGNTFAMGLIAEFTAADFKPAGAKKRAEILWRLQPTDRTLNLLEAWLPRTADLSTLAVELISPVGGGVTLAAGALASDFAGVVVTTPYGQAGVCACDEAAGLRRLVIALNPTEPKIGAPATAPPGAWRLRFTCADPARLNGSIICRIQRDHDRMGTFRGARQSYFDDPDDEPFAASGEIATRDVARIRRYGSINGMATHPAFVVPGGYEQTSRKPAPYGSAGALVASPASGQPGHVRCSAPSDTSRVLHGRAGAGTRSGARVRLVGTSNAAPQVARAFARAYLDKANWPASGATFYGVPVAALGADATPSDPDPAENARLMERLGTLMFR